MNEAQDNYYVFGDPAQDRRRLDSQTKLLGQYIATHVRSFFGDNVRAIVDVGCGEGQLGFTLLDVYPGASLLGIDRDAAAVEQASKVATERKLNARFAVGDVQQGLPPGPYDLALISLMLLHSNSPQQILQHTYDQLRSGGGLLVIDVVPNLPAIADFGADYQRLSALLYTTLTRMGLHPLIMDELPALLAGIGFVDFARRESMTDHPAITHNATERTWASAAGIGAIYNARHGIAAATGTPVAEIEQMVARVANHWTLQPVANMPPVFAVATALKP